MAGVKQVVVTEHKRGFLERRATTLDRPLLAPWRRHWSGVSGQVREYYDGKGVARDAGA
jgi:hypothetical protein